MTCFYKKCSSLIQSSFLTIFFLLISKPIWIKLTYFLALSLVGYLAFKVSKPRTNSFSLSDLDLFFTSVSSATVSSMSTVEMEVFSNTQLIFMTILMFMGGEVFISLLGLQLGRSNFPKHQSNYIGCYRTTPLPYVDHHRIELRGGPVHEGTPSLQGSGRLPPCSGLEDKISKIDVESHVNSDIITNECDLKERSIKFLHYLTLAYILAFNICGSILVGMYISHVPSAKDVIISKGLQLHTFSIFTTVSSFANCGFIPTNENMMAFKSNPGLLLLLIPQILMGNTLYAPCLRFLIWFLEKTTNRDEFKHMLKLKDSSYGGHLLSGFRCLMAVATALGLISVQVVLFWVMEWNSEAMDGLRSG